MAYNGFSLDSTGWHPFKAAAVEYIEGHQEYSGSLLEKYYRSWRPAHALEALIGALKGPDELRAWPAHVVHVPWLDASPAERQVLLEMLLLGENSAFGAPDLNVEDGYGLQGPVSERKGKLEYSRIVMLVRSIRERGYDRSRGDLRVQVLQRGKEYRFRVAHGHHRAAVLAALQHEVVPAIPTMLVRREEVEHWPQVYRGLWSREQALVYFDHHFDFDSRGWASIIGLA